MIKLVKNEFFIYCKETRIESNRSFYGSFSLGPFDTGQSITIANALRRTLLSELKGLAITSAEIEGALHEYSTLPGVRDSVLDILLNLKDIVLKTENYGNKKRGTSYAATFKKTQIAYLKTRGPGIVTASELKLPPGIQCVDPDQYIATLSEEGILNIKLTINEGKNYVIQSSYSPNQGENLGPKKMIDAKKKLVTQNLSLKKKASKQAELKKEKKVSIGKNLKPDKPGINNDISPSTGFISYLNSKRKRLWLQKINLLKIPFFFSLSGLVIRNKKQKFLSQRTTQLESSSLPASSPDNFGEVKEIGLLNEKDQALKLEKKEKIKLFSFLQIKNRSFIKTKEGIEKKKQNSFFDQEKEKSPLFLKSFFENSQQNNLQFTESNQISLISGELPHIREGRAITASKAVSLVIDAVFMPVNKVNYIIEINEQSVMSKNLSNTHSLSLTSLGSEKKKSKTLPIFNEVLGKELDEFPKKKDIFQIPVKKEPKKSFFKSVAAHKIIGAQLNISTDSSFLDFSVPEDFKESDLQKKEKNKMRLSDNLIKTPLKNNIILEIWTNGSIHPRQALYEACKNLLSLFSKLEKATPLAFKDV